MTQTIKIKKLNESAIIPTYGSEYAAGADLYACIPSPIVILPNQTIKIGTGIALDLPIGYAGFIYPRSGLATKQGLAPANKVGVADCDYRGEYIVALHNHSTEPQTVHPFDRIAQLVIAPYITANFLMVDELNDTERGSNGFGSTGK